MTAEENGQFRLFTPIRHPDENPHYPKSAAREQMAYWQAAKLGDLAVAQEVEQASEEDSEHSNEDN